MPELFGGSARRVLEMHIKRILAYLLVRVAQLVLQDRLSIDQELHFIGESIKRPRESLC